jgi:hypothetical protein
MAEPPEIGMIVPKDGKAFEFWGLELDFGLDELSVVVARFLELVVVAGLTELPATKGKIAERVAMMVAVVEIAALRLNLAKSP